MHWRREAAGRMATLTLGETGIQTIEGKTGSPTTEATAAQLAATAGGHSLGATLSRAFPPGTPPGAPGEDLRSPSVPGKGRGG